MLNDMKWLLQKNIWNEYGYDRLINSIEDACIDYEEVHLIPFTETFEKEIGFVPDLIFGSNRFVNVCRSKGFPTFKSFNPTEMHYPNTHWVNAWGEDFKWGDLPKLDFTVPQFIKPYTEKFFTGKVVECLDDLKKIQLGNSFIEDENEEMVRVSDAKNIEQEIRFYIIANTIISASQYRDSGQVSHRRVDYQHPSWESCQNLLNRYGGADDAFVMDLGLVGDKWKIVELNNINSSGLYETNTDAIVNAFKHL